MPPLLWEEAFLGGTSPRWDPSEEGALWALSPWPCLLLAGPYPFRR